MKGHFKRMLIGSSVILISMGMLTACNTVAGTMGGVSSDVQAVTTPAPPPEPVMYKHKQMMHKKMMMHKKNMHHKMVHKKEMHTEMTNPDGSMTTNTTKSTTTQSTTY